MLARADVPDLLAPESILTVLLLLFGATAVFVNVQGSLNTIWGVDGEEDRSKRKREIALDARGGERSVDLSRGLGPRDQREVDVVYGPGASVVAFLAWIYFSAQIFLLGAEFIWVWSRRRGRGRVEPSRPRPDTRHGTGLAPRARGTRRAPS